MPGSAARCATSTRAPRLGDARPEPDRLELHEAQRQQRPADVRVEIDTGGAIERGPAGAAHGQTAFAEQRVQRLGRGDRQPVAVTRDAVGAIDDAGGRGQGQSTGDPGEQRAGIAYARRELDRSEAPDEGEHSEGVEKYHVQLPGRRLAGRHPGRLRRTAGARAPCHTGCAQGIAGRVARADQVSGTRKPMNVVDLETIRLSVAPMMDWTDCLVNHELVGTWYIIGTPSMGVTGFQVCR